PHMDPLILSFVRISYPVLMLHSGFAVLQCFSSSKLEEVQRNTKHDVVQGEELRIRCPVVFCSQTPPTVVWYKVDEPQIQINTSSSRGMKIVWEQTKKLEGTSFLVFERIHRNNSGLYRCALKGTIGHSITVQLYASLVFVNVPVLVAAVKPKETQPENQVRQQTLKPCDLLLLSLFNIFKFLQYASVPMVELSGHLQLSARGSPVVPPGRRLTKRRPGESTPSGNNQQLHPPMSQDRNRQRGVDTEDNTSGVLYVTLNLQQRPGGRTARTEEPPSEYAAIRVK
uniref:Ig-like domain-containing protein n=1 Tax=Oryzias latipes TaxID=8090 RepID=A0A3B3HY82_ORYLA